MHPTWLDTQSVVRLLCLRTTDSMLFLLVVAVAVVAMVTVVAVVAAAVVVAVVAVAQAVGQCASERVCELSSAAPHLPLLLTRSAP